MPISELEALTKIADLNMRKSLLKLIDLRKQIEEELKKENLSVEKEVQLTDALKMIQDSMDALRFSGIMET